MDTQRSVVKWKMQHHFKWNPIPKNFSTSFKISFIPFIRLIATDTHWSRWLAQTNGKHFQMVRNQWAFKMIEIHAQIRSAIVIHSLCPFRRISETVDTCGHDIWIKLNELPETLLCCPFWLYLRMCVSACVWTNKCDYI